MEEILFIAERTDEGRYVTRAFEHSIFTEADTVEALKEEIKEAVECHFDQEAERPKMIRLRTVKDEVFPLNASKDANH